MIIGIDARELEGKPTGVGTYLRNILSNLVLPFRAEIQLFFKDEIPGGLPANTEPVLLKSSANNATWQQWIFCRELKKRKVSLLFSPANSLPWYFPGIQVMTIHDLSYFRNPGWFHAKERLSRQLNTSVSVCQADRIYVVSDFVKQEVIRRFRIRPDRILVTPNGVTSKKRLDPQSRQQLRESHGLADRKLILYAGSIFNRRHLPVLIEAIARLDASRVLAVIGDNRTYPRQDLNEAASRNGVAERTRILEYATDAVLEEYYQMADLFVYLSDYEGFGIPPLEAMSYGIPVVLSATPAMNTIFQDAACFVERISAADVASAIELCLENPPDRDRWIDAGLELVRRHSWQHTAGLICADWEQLLAARN